MLRTKVKTFFMEVKFSRVTFLLILSQTKMKSFILEAKLFETIGDLQFEDHGSKTNAKLLFPL